MDPKLAAVHAALSSIISGKLGDSAMRLTAAVALAKLDAYLSSLKGETYAPLHPHS